MQIDTSWKIEADSMNVILYQRHKRKKDGQYVWLVAGYFSDVKNALHELIEQKVRQSKLTDLQKVESAINELHTIIDSLQGSDQINPKTLQANLKHLKPSKATIYHQRRKVRIK